MGGVSREGSRLLALLGEAGAYAMTDPLDGRAIIVRRERDGVSVGAGRFPAARARELVRLDLAEAYGPAVRRAFRISEPGRLHLRRAAAPDAPFRAQHGSVEATVTIEGERVAVRVNPDESPLDGLRRRRDAAGRPLIDAAGHEAGERLRRDLTAAMMLPRVTADWTAPVAGRGRGGPREIAATDSALAARQRVERALAAVGPDFADLLVDLCGFLKGLSAIERERGWPARSGKLFVRLALSRLAEHYGLGPVATGPERGALRAWREARP
ncbi:MAG TPA: DUF6456 domain-containing protein [Beijerinckiaceae bacterium]|nr:DUF6456 domain-containing protein [Beijerinckiaceae bacterium]